MNDRATAILQIRPEIPSARITDGMSADEYFQNGTLRPILKLQNDVLVASFKNYIVKHKNAFHNLTLEKRMSYIENAIQKDVKYRNVLKGILIGQFTVTEYETYIQNSSALNKRMMRMVVKRLQDQIQIFESTIVV